YGSVYRSSLSWYLAVNRFGDNGWRTDSHTDVRQGFGKLGWERGKTSLNLTFSGANNSMNGNGLQEHRLLANDYAGVYTKPDNIHNRAASINLLGKYLLRNHVVLAGNLYYRS